jgi:hypothetical protein
MEQGTTKFLDLFTYKSPEGEINNEPSLTIPDETMSIREILSRYSRGLSVDQKVPYFDEEDYHPDLSKMDLADREDYIEKVKQELKDLHEKLKTEDTNAEEVTQKEKEG